jgi:arylsulfatase A-like enzyme
MKLNRLIVCISVCVYAVLLSSCSKDIKKAQAAVHQHKPNVILIYVDDVGYGDIGSNGGQSIATPHIDRLAKEGVRFTNAHSDASTCTPSRYSILTGRYAWRKKGTGIARGNAPLLIDTSRVTIADVMKQAGYRTAAIGKWHLGLGPAPQGPDWNGVIKPGPLELGFNYCFLIPATPDRQPTVYLQNHRIYNYNPFDPIRVSYKHPIGNRPTGKEAPQKEWMKSVIGHQQTITNGIARIGYMAGGQTAVWDDSLISDVMTAHALRFIKKNQHHPFFLYFASHDVHVPRVPDRRFAGKSGMGPRGDELLEMDWEVGQIKKTLDSLGIAKNTMIIFTSDNGPVLNDGYQDGAVQGAMHPKVTPYNKDLLPPREAGQPQPGLPPHRPAGQMRGGKYSIFEGGTRIPFIVYWPGHTKKGMVSDALISQIDLLASFAALTRQNIDPSAGPDSFNMLPVLLGKSTEGRKTLVEQTNSPPPLALIHGHWKYIAPAPKKPASISWARPRIESGNSSKPQLYNLKKDLGETHNLADKYPKKLKKMKELLKEIKNRSHSRGK